MQWYLEVLKKYVVFSGRARRKEYWMFVLINTIIGVVLGIIDGAVFGSEIGIISNLYMLAVFLPSISVGIRRLHDTGRSGWWTLLVLIPILGALVLLFFLIQDSKHSDNQYGKNPKEAFA